MEIFEDALKNLLRRKTRTLLAIFGVGTGVFAFLLMGALAGHFQKMAGGFEKIYKNRVFVCERPTFWAGGGILSEAKSAKVAAVKGVEETIPILISRFRTDNMVLVGIPWVVIGVEPAKLQMVAGGFETEANGPAEMKEGQAIIGADIAAEMKLVKGAPLEIEGGRFTAAGIYKKTGGLLDGQIFVPLPQAQEIYHRKGLVTSILAIPDKNTDPESLAQLIKKQVDGIEALPPSKFDAQVRSSLRLWNSLAYSAAFSASLTGALCVIIVMLVAVSERIVEIGIKKAIGATTLQIILELLSESAAICLVGWLGGLVAALVTAHYGGKWIQTAGSSFFLFTPSLVFTALWGTLAVGIIAGLYPAVRASLLDPVEALKIKY